jgi:hypothetical protein
VDRLAGGEGEAHYVSLTTAAGRAMGYFHQESGNLLSTIIVYNSPFAVPLTIGYVLEWLQ